MVKPKNKRDHQTFTKEIRRKKNNEDNHKKVKNHVRREKTKNRKVADDRMDSEDDHHDEETLEVKLNAQEQAKVEEKAQMQNNESLQGESKELVEKSQSLESLISRIISEIYSPDFDTQIKAITDLQATIQSEDSEKAIKRLIEVNFIPTLFEVFHKTIIPCFKAKILKVLSLIWQGCEAELKRFIETGGIDFLLGILGYGTVEIIEVATQILGDLAAISIKYRDTILEKGTVNKLEKYLKWIIDPKSINNIAISLSNLCSGQKKAQAKYVAKIIEYFFEQIKQKTLEKKTLSVVLQTTAKYFENIFYNEQMLIDHNMPEHIFQIVEKTIASSDMKQQQIELFEQEKPYSANTSNNQDSIILSSCLRLFYVFCFPEEYYIQPQSLDLLYKFNLTKILETLIDHTVSDVRYYVIRVIRCIVIYSSKRMKETLENDYLMKRVMKLLQNDGYETQKEIFQMFQMATLKEKERLNLILMGFFEKYDVVGTLISLLNRSLDNDFTINVLSIFQRLLEFGRKIYFIKKKKEKIQSNPIANMILRSPEAITVFVEMEKHENKDISDYTYSILDRYLEELLPELEPEDFDD